MLRGQLSAPTCKERNIEIGGWCVLACPTCTQFLPTRGDVGVAREGEVTRGRARFGVGAVAGSPILLSRYIHISCETTGELVHLRLARVS